jgi:hypothetical protein
MDFDRLTITLLAVRAGMYRTIVLPWMVPAGAMNFTRTRFPRSMSEATGT